MDDNLSFLLENLTQWSKPLMLFEILDFYGLKMWTFGMCTSMVYLLMISLEKFLCHEYSTFGRTMMHTAAHIVLDFGKKTLEI